VTDGVLADTAPTAGPVFTERTSLDSGRGGDHWWRKAVVYPVYMRSRSNGADPGRDNRRVPLPWSGTSRPFWYSPAGATQWP
jgi:hypothetical protein